MKTDLLGRPIDQSVATLTKAVKQIESSGNYDARGASGERGAYQWMPGNFEAGAKKYGITPDWSPEAQDKVAYHTFKEWKDQGLTPEQALAKWNSGSPEGWEKKVGVNRFGVRYDVPAYVQKGMAAALQIRQARAASQMPQMPAIPQMSPSQQADQASGLRTGAFFPSQQGESGMMAGLRTAGNLAPSAFNFARGVVDTLNPFRIARDVFQNIPQAFGELVSQQGGSVAGAIGATAREAPRTVFDTFVPIGAQQAASGIAGMATGDRIGRAQDLEEAQRNFVNDPIGTVAPLVLGARGAAGLIDRTTAGVAASRMGSYVDNIGRNVDQGVPIPRATGTRLGSMMDDAISRTARPITESTRTAFGRGREAVGAQPPKSAAEVAGEIVQGDTRMQPIAQRVLTDPGLDTQGVKTYADLASRLESSIQQNISRVDAEYARNPNPVRMADLTQRSKGVGSINYVAEALKHLDELFTKSRDMERAAQIRQLRTRARREGLTASEINQVARVYGAEFGKKAFNPRTGDPLTSVNARLFENVRSGVKKTARNLLADDAAKALDKSLSEQIRVKTRIDQLVEAVNRLEQRVERRGLLQKAGRALGGTLDLVTAGFLRAFVQKFLVDSNVGNKSFNYLGIEERLAANLKRLQYMERVNDSTLVGILARAAREINQLPETVSKPATAVRSATVFGRSQPEPAP